MRWRLVARRDAGATAGARSVKLLLGLTVLVVLLAGYVYPVFGSEPITTARFAGFVVGPLTTLVPFVGIVLGYNAVAGEHESGALRLSLSLPHARRDVVVGTYASRAGLLAATLCVAMAGAGALVVYPFGTLDPLRFLAFVLLTVAFGAVWCGLGLAVSLATATGRRALAGGFGLLFLFVVVWDALGSALRPALDAVGLARGALPEPVRFVLGLEPGRVFARVTAGFVDPTGAVPDAWYLGEWVALALFALWLVAPLGLAARRFGRRDLS